MFFHTKYWILWPVICATGSASIHFVKYSMATTRYFIYRTARGNGPRMSIPQVWNDHGLSGLVRWGRIMPISMSLALLASLCIPRAIFPYGWPVVPRTNGFWRESSTTDVISTYPFVELCHDARALFTTYANQDRVCIPMSEQIPIHKSIPARILLDYSGLCGLQRKYPSTK